MKSQALNNADVADNETMIQAFPYLGPKYYRAALMGCGYGLVKLGLFVNYLRGIK